MRGTRMDNGDRLPGSDTGAKPRRSLPAVLENGRRYFEERAFMAVGRFHATRRKRPTADKPRAMPSSPQPVPEPTATAKSVTETALKSIVEVRRTIRPEFSAGALTLLVPAIVICLLLIVAAISPLAQILLSEGSGYGALSGFTPPPAQYTPPAGLGSPYGGTQ
jgi:hypothetical protein